MTLHLNGLGKIELKQIDTIIENMCVLVEANEKLKTELENSSDWKTRWMTLERVILDNLDNLGLDSSQYHNLWVRERFFYKMQKKTGFDYGFCKYFIPAFRNRTESILTDNLKIDMSNKCNYGGKTLETTCSGTDRDICVFLHPEMKELRKNPPKYN